MSCILFSTVPYDDQGDHRNNMIMMKKASVDEEASRSGLKDMHRLVQYRCVVTVADSHVNCQPLRETGL